MKLSILIVSIVLCLAPWKSANLSENCNPDKGISTAILTRIEVSQNDLENDIQEKKFDEDGNLIYIKSGSSMFQDYYELNKLQFRTATRKILPNFYVQHELDSILAKAKSETDTTFVLSHYSDGRVQKMIDADSSYWHLDYQGCDEDFTTITTLNGDTLQQFYSKRENGLLVEQTWTSIQPYDYHIVWNYFDYELNKKGHWVKRKCSKNEDVYSETRELSYY